MESLRMLKQPGIIRAASLPFPTNHKPQKASAPPTPSILPGQSLSSGIPRRDPALRVCVGSALPPALPPLPPLSPLPARSWAAPGPGVPGAAADAGAASHPAQPLCGSAFYTSP